MRNLLFADDCEPAIIDLSPYWRPASYAIALTVVDAVLWYGGSTELLGELTQLDECRQMIARGLIFRLAIDGLFAVEHPGARQRYCGTDAVCAMIPWPEKCL